MHPDELANWERLKKVFEESGNTDNFYYKRACAIVGGKPDPLATPLNAKPNEWDKTLSLFDERGMSGDDW